MILIDVDKYSWSKEVLFALLKERTPEQSISHKKMPTWEEHCEFVESSPYESWYVIKVGSDIVGSVYITDRREVGIFIFKRFHGNGYGHKAIAAVRALHPGRLLANVNPRNDVSCDMFEMMGGRVIQVTYELH